MDEDQSDAAHQQELEHQQYEEGGTMKVYEAISRVTKSLAQDGISKARKNQQQGYNFRGIDDVYNALSAALSSNGLCMLPRILSRVCEERTTAKGSALFYVTVEAEFDLVCAEDGSKHVIRTFGEAMDSADKATNKAMSAAYKYAAMQAFCIPTEGDNDADSTTHEVAAKPQPARITPTTGAWESMSADQQEALTDIAMEVISKIGALTADEAMDAHDYLEAQNLTHEEKIAIWTRFDSKQRAAIKKAAESLKNKATA